jgi:hypothetical protein
MLNFIRRSLLLIALILAVVSLGACAMFRPNLSWAEDLGEADAANVAEMVAARVADSVPSGGKPVALVAPAAGRSGNPFAEQLIAALEARGTEMVDETSAKDAHRLRYVLTAYQDGYVLRIILDDTESSAMLSRGTGGQLMAVAPLAVRGGPR